MIGQRRPPLPTIIPLRLRLENEGHVELIIYDASGSPVRTLLETRLNPGVHDVRWDGLDAAGREVPRGNYTYTVTVDGTQVEERPLWIP